jgi:hypothetical protein
MGFLHSCVPRDACLYAINANDREAFKQIVPDRILLTAPKNMGTGIPNNKVYYREPCLKIALTSQGGLYCSIWYGLHLSVSAGWYPTYRNARGPGRAIRWGVDMGRAVPDATETTVGHNGTWEACILQRVQPSMVSQAGGVESKRRDLYFARTDPESPSLL